VLSFRLTHSVLNFAGSVNNPNYFGVSISKINADVCFCSNLFLVNIFAYVPTQIFYPINNTKLGNGNESNINFPAHSQTNFTFPIDITYQTSLDPSNKILVDIATKCGFIGGGAKSQITVNYKITVGLGSYTSDSQLLTGQYAQIGIRIFCITISPDISNSLSFDCPISQGDISVSRAECPLIVLAQLIYLCSHWILVYPEAPRVYMFETRVHLSFIIDILSDISQIVFVNSELYKQI
jgi:hypothetical protein